MKITITQVKAKAQAKQLASYLKTINRKVTFGNALEAVSQMYGAKTWNNFCADLVNQPATPVVESDTVAPFSPILTFTVVDDSVEWSAYVQASVHSDDHVSKTVFDAGPWLLNASTEQVIALAYDRWGYCYAADDVARESSAWDGDVENVFDYVETVNRARSLSGDSMGFEVDIVQANAMRFLRAFRYDLFVRLVIEEVEYKDFSVKQCDNGLGWAYTFRGQLSAKSFETEAAAWTALGVEMEDHDLVPWEDDFLLGVKDVVPHSGRATPDEEPPVAGLADAVEIAAPAHLDTDAAQGNTKFCLPFGIEIECSNGNGGSLISNLTSELTTEDDDAVTSAAGKAAANAIEALLLALACAKVDLSTPAVALAIKNVVADLADEIS